MKAAAHSSRSQIVTLNAAKKEAVAVSSIESLIYVMRGHKVMLDHDLAELYGVETKVLNQAVRRNIERFPSDFMFQLTHEEAESSRSQIVTLKIKRGQNFKYAPYAFTEHGIAMLSSVLRSPRAIQMNILIIRAFVRMRELIATHKELAMKVEKLERGHEQTNSVIEVLIEDIDKLSKDIHWIKNPPLPRKHRIGFVGKESEE
jgi:phage regulator Rha-like protein